MVYGTFSCTYSNTAHIMNPQQEIRVIPMSNNRNKKSTLICEIVDKSANNEYSRLNYNQRTIIRRVVKRKNIKNKEYRNINGYKMLTPS